MTWIPDLSGHAYVVAAPFVRAIGWLSREHPFPTGAVPSEFVDRLTALARRADTAELAYGFGHFMGYHVCDLCPPGVTRVGDTSRNSGLHNFAVPFAPLLFVCPELIPHYVRDHGYRPPEEFVAAVLDMPLPERLEDLIRATAATSTNEDEGPLAQIVALHQAVHATEYGRIATTFLARLTTLRSLDGAIIAAEARRWTVKGQCPRCGRWTYGHGVTAECCAVPLIDVERRTIAASARGIVIVMGVAGAGKTTVGQRLAERAVWLFRDADDLHPLANIAKMRRGEALTDADRAPWLEALHELLSATAAAGRSLVLACSALKAGFRSRLTKDIPDVKVVYLRVPKDELHRRLSVRSDHFFSPSLLDSQLAALEEPTDAMVVDGATPPEAIVTMILDRLGLPNSIAP